MTTASIQVYGAENELTGLSKRLQVLMPSAQSLTPAEAMAVAQIALAHGLDPFNGEVWGIKGPAESGGKWYGVMVGIKGLRKCASKQAEREGFTYWSEYRYVTPKSYGQADTAIVVEWIIRDNKTIEAYAKSLRALRDATVPYDEAKEMIGAIPMAKGVGIATVDERSKMKLHARAIKRAEADAIKKRFNVDFGSGVITEGQAIDAEVSDIVDGLEGDTGNSLDKLENEQAKSRVSPQLSVDEMFPPDVTSEERIKAISGEEQAKSLAGIKESKAMPRPTESDKNEWSVFAIQFVIEAGYAKDAFGAKGMLNLSKLLPKDATESEIERWCKEYRKHRPLGTKNSDTSVMSAERAAVEADTALGL